MLIFSRTDSGSAGEDAAAAFLERAGVRILHRNWRSGHLELDIVCLYEGFLVFVEVKTRAINGMTHPAEHVGPAKRRHLIQAARRYLAVNSAWERPCRFDVVCVWKEGREYRVEHYPDAFELADTLGGGNAAWQPW